MAWIEPIARLILSVVLLASAGYLAVQSLGRTLYGRLGCALLVSVSAVVLTGDPLLLEIFGPMRWPLLSFAALAPFLYWLTANGFFVDGFYLKPSHLWLSLVMIALGVAPDLLAYDDRLSATAHYLALVTSFGFVIHGTAIVWLGHETDLDSGRYRFRARYAVLPLIYLLLVGLQEALLSAGMSVAAGHINFANGIYLSVAAIYLTLLLHHYVSSRDSRKLKKQLVPFEAFAGKLKAEDAAALERLSEQLQRRRVYTDDQLTLPHLAELAEVSVSKARRLLSGAYGYRNFSKLLDAYRVKTAKSYLGDVDAAHMPIRDIAAIVGFKNENALIQAFYRLEKETPAEFRQRAIDESSAATRLHLTNTDR